MPRTAQGSLGGGLYSVPNQGGRRRPVFPKPPDYNALVAAMKNDAERLSRERPWPLISAWPLARLSL